MSGALRVGLVGFGLAGEVFHAPLIAATDGLDLTTIVTANPQRAAAARDAYRSTRIAGSVDELWDDIDLLVVATPNDSHIPLASEALNRDLAVVVDKPLAVSAPAAEALVARGAKLTVFQNRRWDGDFLTIRSAIDAGELGDLIRFESRFDRFRPEVAGERWRESSDPAIGGGLLLDLGAHLVDQAMILGGDVIEVYATLDVRRPGAVVEDDVFLSLTHTGGVRSQLWMSAIAPLHRPRLRVGGTKAGIVTHGLDPQEAQLQDGTRPGDAGYGVLEEAPVFADAEGRRDMVPIPGAYEEFYAGVVAWLRDGAPPPVDAADSLAVLRVLDAARESAATATIVHMEA